jgi:hypothetical protein
MKVSELLKALQNADPAATVLFMEATVDTRHAVKVHDVVNACGTGLIVYRGPLANTKFLNRSTAFSRRLLARLT